MIRKSYKALPWIDCLFVLLNILNGGLSILPLLLLFDYIPYNLALITVLNIGWCIFNSHQVKFRLFPKALIPFSFVLAFQVLLGRFEFSFTMLLHNVSFFLLLNGMVGKYKEKSVSLLSDLYISYSLLNVICVCLAFLLILGGFLYPFSNSIDVSILAKDDEIAFFPGYLTVLRPDDVIRVSFIPVFGLFCGYSHEPHVVGYICIPAFFILMARLKDSCRLIKFLVISIYTFFFLITISATSFLALSLTIMAGLLMRGLQKGQGKTLLLFILLLVFAIISIAYISDTFSFVFDKVNATDGSKDYSAERLTYAFTPHTIFGTTIYTTEIDGDIGLISAALNLWFYIAFGLLSFKMLKNEDKTVFYYGLALFYFFCHSMKAFLMIYRYPFTVFMIFLSYLVYKSYKAATRKPIEECINDLQAT